MSRPSSFTDEIADRNCDGIASGKSLIKVCLDEDMPEARTVLRWVAKGDMGDERYAEFRQQYAHAMDARADYMAEEQLDIADSSADDLRADENGVVDPVEHIQRAKLRIETRKWLMGKMKPKKYGDKITTEHTGANGGPIQTQDLTLTPQEAKAIKNLVINIPPRYGRPKSSKMWMAQSLARNPSAAFIHVSYSAELALDNSAYTKELVQSAEFQQLWPIEIKDSTDAKGLWKTTKQGGVKAGAAGGPVTGFGAGSIDYEPGMAFAGAIISDDPLKPDDAGSTTLRTKVNARFYGTLKSRRHGRHTPIVLVMQRLHEDDPSGYALKGKLGLPFHHLKIKALQDDGTALWPAMHTADELLAMKMADRYTFAGQYQQEPTPSEGGIFQVKWIQRYGVRPAVFDQIVQSWDTAYKAKQHNDPSVCTTWGVTKTGYYLLDVWCEKVEYPALKRATTSLAEKWIPDAILIEDKASGQSLLQDLKSTKLPVIAIHPAADKQTRARTVSSQFEAGKVFLPETAAGLLDYEQELGLFPNAAHDDRVDSTSQFLSWVKSRQSQPTFNIRQL